MQFHNATGVLKLFLDCADKSVIEITVEYVNSDPDRYYKLQDMQLLNECIYL